MWRKRNNKRFVIWSSCEPVKTSTNRSSLAQRKTTNQIPPSLYACTHICSPWWSWCKTQAIVQNLVLVLFLKFTDGEERKPVKTVFISPLIHTPLLPRGKFHMWTSGDPLSAVPVVTRILTPLTHPTPLPSCSPASFCIVQQRLRAVCCFPSPSTCINQEAICHQHSGSVGVNKQQEPAVETGMTQACPSNRGEQVIFGTFCIHLHCVYQGVVYFCFCVGAHWFGLLWDYTVGKHEATFSFLSF